MNFREEMDRILQTRRKDSSLTLRLLREFRKNLKLNKDIEASELKYMQAFSETYMCEAYLMLGDINKARETGVKAMKMELRAGIEDLLLLTYNLLGYAYGCTMNYVGASTCFYSGLELAKKLNNIEMQRVLYANFGVAYVRLKKYDKAKELFDKSWQMNQMRTLPEDKAKIAEHEHEVQMIEYYFGIGEYSKALALLVEGTSEYEVMSARIAAEKNELKDAEAAVGRYLKLNPKPVGNCIEQFDAYHELVEITLKIEHQYYTTVCLDRLYAAAQKSGVPVYMAEYYSFMIKACNLFHWDMKENYYEKFYLYDQEASKQRDENERACLLNELEIFQVKRKQHLIEKKNERLKNLSMKDQLTKIYNRAGFQMKMEEMLTKAKSGQTAFGLCMIDVDDFKDINDTHGHLYGDECLCNVAKTIRSCFGKNAEICRYGGDEFVVLSLDVSDEEYKKSLKRLLKHRNLKTEKCQITLSMGAINCVPTDYATDTDYIFSADELLYCVKKDTKNNYIYETELR